MLKAPLDVAGPPVQRWDITSMHDDWRPRTRLIHGMEDRTDHGETSEALFLTSGFSYRQAEDAEGRFADALPGYMYSRVSNPTVRSFERRMAMLEGADEGSATATGMAAVHAALMCQLRAGSRVVASRLLFGSCLYILNEILPRFGVETVLVDGADLGAWEEALSRPTDVVLIESPGNPTLELVDIAAVAGLAHAAGACVIVDNVFATPLLQRPLALGADVVVYSATKHIDGQGRCLGGVVLGSREYKDKLLHPYLKNTGPALSPFNAWVLSKGLETLALRVTAHVENATRLACWLESHPAVDHVLYPGLESHPQHALARRQMSGAGGLLAIRAGGGRSGAFAIMNRLRLAAISNNLGDAKTLVTHPASTTHSKIPAETRAAIGITEDLIRISVGLEDFEDVMADMDQALQG